MQDTIVVLSRHAELGALVARTLRYRRVYTTLKPLRAPFEEIRVLAPRGVIVATDVRDASVLSQVDPALLSSGLPLLVLGMAAVEMCEHFGGTASQPVISAGSVTLELSEEPLFEGVDGGEHVLHHLCDLRLPECLQAIATATERVIGYRHKELPLFGLQYPIERNDPDAAQLLYNFATGVCGARDNWDEDVVIDRAVEHIRRIAPDGRVMCAVSGGVDSAVCAKLAHLAVGDRLICVFVDTGLFRTSEPQLVVDGFLEGMGLVAAHVDASDMFLRALSGVSSAADKERIASSLMTQVLLKQLSYEPDIRTLIMGTNLNDTLYGISPTAPIDKAVGDKLNVVEPIRDLFKDEVRRLALALQLPTSIAERRPFPASGLALRIFGGVNEDRLAVLRKADAIFREEVRAGGHEKRLWQYYATLISSPDHPDGYAICLRALQPVQGGANSARLPFDVLERATERILRDIDSVTRVVYDLTPSVHYGELE